MTEPSFERNEFDSVLLGWTLVWSAFLTIATIGLVKGTTSQTLSDDNPFFCGMVVGGLCAAWTLAGTWIALMHLTPPFAVPDADGVMPQLMLPRLGPLLVLLANMVVVASMLRHDRPLISLIMLAVGTSIAGPVLVWQWTGRRIHRSVFSAANKRSIRQTLGLATTVAIVIGALKFSHRWLGLSSLDLAMAISLATLWTMLLMVKLCRSWWLIFLTIPVAMLQWIAMTLYMDDVSREGEMQVMRFAGMLLGFYGFAWLLLTVARSSGHRWIGAE